MTIMMPAADEAVLQRKDSIVAALRQIVPGEGVISSAAEMLPYESDGLTAYRQPPMVVRQLASGTFSPRHFTNSVNDGKRSRACPTRSPLSL